MKTKKGSVILISALALIAVGVLLSIFVNWPIDRGNADGDIAKSSRFSRKTAAESLSMMEELIRSDENYKNSVVVSYVVMLTRAQQFSSLVDLSNEAAGEIPAFAGVLGKMNDVRELAGNACATLEEAGESLETTLSGGSSPELGQRTNNAALAYLALQKQNTLATQFIDTADKYLASNEGSDELKFVRDQWLEYQQATASLEGDSKLEKKLAGKEAMLSADETLGILHRLTPDSVNEGNLIGESASTPMLGISGLLPLEIFGKFREMPTLSHAFEETLLEDREVLDVGKDYIRQDAILGREAGSLIEEIANGNIEALAGRAGKAGHNRQPGML